VRDKSLYDRRTEYGSVIGYIIEAFVTKQPDARTDSEFALLSLMIRLSGGFSGTMSSFSQRRTDRLRSI
jgi:hypothetical protein